MGSRGRICPWLTGAVKETFWEVLYLILMLDGGVMGGIYTAFFLKTTLGSENWMVINRSAISLKKMGKARRIKDLKSTQCNIVEAIINNNN